jgi:cytochrome b
VEREPSASDEPASGASVRAAAPAEDLRRVTVWDLPTRLFHWLSAAFVAAAYATWRLNWMEWHAWVGDALLALVLFRLAWGLFGGETARFRHFVKSPGSALRHLAQIFCREPDHQIGHNPAGGWMVVVLLALMLAQALTGLYVDNDVANEGPLTELVPAPIANLITALHDRLLWDALLAAVALHVLAILAYRAAKRQNLLAPMITGRKTLPQSVPAPQMRGPVRALVCLVGAAVVAAALAIYS